MSEATYREKFDKITNLLLAAYLTFYVWKALQKEENNDVFTGSEFWTVVIPALQHEWFIGLARLYEDSNYSKRGTVLSVYSLIPEHPDKERAKQAEDFLEKNAATLNSINRVRDHEHAHNNTTHLLKPGELFKRFPLKYHEIEELFEFTDKLLSILNPEEGHSWVVSHLREDAERDTEDVISGLRYFKTQRTKHRERYARGETDDHTFPPVEGGV